MKYNTDRDETRSEDQSQNPTKYAGSYIEELGL